MVADDAVAPALDHVVLLDTNAAVSDSDGPASCEAHDAEADANAVREARAARQGVVVSLATLACSLPALIGA